MCKGVWEKPPVPIAMNNTVVCQVIKIWLHVASTHIIVGWNNHSILNIRHSSPNIYIYIYISEIPLKTFAIHTANLTYMGKVWSCFNIALGVKNLRKSRTSYLHHVMAMLSTSLPLCDENSLIITTFLLTEGWWCTALMLALISCWTKK